MVCGILQHWGVASSVATLCVDLINTKLDLECSCIDGFMYGGCVVGNHVTLVAHSLSVQKSLQAADELAQHEIECEVCVVMCVVTGRWMDLDTK